MHPQLTIREIEPGDAEPVAHLASELGYPVSTEAMTRRLADLRALHDHAVYVACIADEVVAWIDIGVVHHLQSDPYGEIGGLVVSAAHRGAGIGKALLAKAEVWIRRRGLSRVVVRSRVAREGAHRFYTREGYTQTKISAVFCKALQLYRPWPPQERGG